MSGHDARKALSKWSNGKRLTPAVQKIGVECSGGNLSEAVALVTGAAERVLAEFAAPGSR